MRRKIIIAGIIGAVIFVYSQFAVSEVDRKKKDEYYKQVELFSDALAIVDSEYVNETEPRDLIYGALKGMLASLDPYSQFMDPDTYTELKVDTEGKFGGLGIEITIKDGLLTVVTPIEDTPAWDAGIKANDKIVKIDNELTRDIALTDAVKKLRGQPGEPVNLTILRESEKKILEFRIVRDIIKIKEIKQAIILQDGIGYIRLVEFRESTPQEIISAIERLSKEGMNALILDLRNNPGGLLDVAVKVAGEFIEKDKLVVYTKGRKPSQNLEFVSNARDPILDIPMAVMINEGSASGSEIVAGCLQDYKRAIILGKKSFGKGSVQTVIPLRDGSAVRLTSSKYFTPSGKVIHENGVVPDIVVEAGIIQTPEKKEGEGEEAKEIFEKIEEKEIKEEPAKEEPKKEFDYKTDNQLTRAVDVLKAIKFYRETKK